MRMLQFDQFNSVTGHERVDASAGIIFGVCVMRTGEAKGHGITLDDGSLNSFLQLTKGRKVGVRFGADHKAGAEDFTGNLQDFRKESGMIKADLHLLKSDLNFSKIVEMAEKMPDEFGLSASTDAEKTKDGKSFKSPVRFTELYCVDVVTNPAATNGLFFSEQQQNTNMKKFALLLGLPETATEDEIALALEAKCKMDASKDEAKKKKELEAEADDEEKGKEGAKKFAALEASVLDLSAKLTAIADNTAAAAASAKKAEVEGLKLEAAKDGKVIPMTDETLLKLSVPEIKEMLAKLPKGQLKLSRGPLPGTGTDGKALDRRSPEFRAQLAAKREEGALNLGNRIMAQATGLNLNQN